MASKLTIEQYESINKDLIVDENGNTNKRCPFCNSNIVIEKKSSSYTLKCENECFSIVCRGI